MAPFSKKQFAFAARGVELNSPPDALQPGYFPFVENWRRNNDGALSPRFGLGVGSPVMAAQTPAHSVRRINDSSTGSLVSALVEGAGTHLGICLGDLSAATDKDSGYSGDPLSICVHRPTASVKPYAYVADRSRMRKIDAAGIVKRIGLPQPPNYPAPSLAQPKYAVVDALNDHTTWNLYAGTTAGAKANNTRVDSATRTITAILYDTGTNGWCGIRPSSMDSITEGMRLVIAAAETVVVQRVFQGSGASTIAAILYETGTTGICSLHLTTPFRQIEVDQLLLLTGTVSGGSEYVRVLSVHRTPDGFTSLRLATTGARVTGDTIQAFPALRCYTTGTRAATNSLGATAVEFQVTAGVGAIAQTVALDLSLIASGLPLQPDDFSHIDVYVDKPELVTEIKLWIDVDSTPGTFDKNYFVKILRQNDFTPVTKDTQTSITNDAIRQQREIVARRPIGPRRSPGDDYDPGGLPHVSDPDDYTDQTSAGQAQWTPVKFRISELLVPEAGRVGSDQSRYLNNAGALKLSVNATGTVIVRFSGWWIGGGYGPDVLPGSRPRTYRYRGYDSSTGVASNWSPAAFGGVSPQRQSVTVLADGLAGAEIDKLDFEVYGGQLLGWIYCGTVDNPGAGTLNATFTDAMSDDDLSNRYELSEGDVHYELWPQQRPPIIGDGSFFGSVVSIIGNLAQISNSAQGQIPTNLALGTAIRTGGRDYFIHRIVTMGPPSKFYITESAGVVASNTFVISNPIVTGQNLPVLAGPFFDFYFGMGDLYNPWRLYYTNGNDPDSTRAGGPDAHIVDVEGEILQNMIVLEPRGRAVLLTTSGAFLVEPAFTLADRGGGLFTARRIADAPGLYARWACCKADGEVAYLAKDGVYATDGASARLISQDLRPLFPKGNTPGKTTNGIAPPDMLTAASLVKMRLSYAHRELMFDYIDTTGAMRTMVNERGANDGSGSGRWSSPDWLGWLPQRYAGGVMAHYEEEGRGADGVHGTIACGANGKLYRLADGQADDAATAIAATLDTEQWNDGDPWTNKYIGDSRIDCDTDGGTITVVPGINHRATLLPTVTVSGAAGRQQKTIDFNSGAGQQTKDISLEVATSVTTARPKLYFWAFKYSERPDDSLLRAEDYELKEKGVTWARGAWLYADTTDAGGVVRTRAATFEYTKPDGTKASIAISNIAHAALTDRFYPFESPVYLIASRVRPTDAATWQFAGHRVEGEPAPPLSDGPTAWLLDGSLGARYVEGIKLDIDTLGASVDMGIEVDQNAIQTTINAAANKGPVVANGRAVLPFSFDVPFITHLLRLNPSAPCHVFRVEVIHKPEPDYAYMWWAQQTDMGVEGYKYMGSGWIGLRSTDEVVLEFVCDGTVIAAVWADATTNTSGERRTLHFRMPRNKFRSVYPRAHAATGAGRVALFKDEFHIEWKPWGHEGSWLDANLLGDAHGKGTAPL